MQRHRGHSGARGRLPGPVAGRSGLRLRGLLRGLLAGLLVALLLALPLAQGGKAPAPGHRSAGLDLVASDSVALRPEAPEVQLRLPPVILPGAADWRRPVARARRLGRRAGHPCPALRRPYRLRIRAPPPGVT